MNTAKEQYNMLKSVLRYTKMKVQTFLLSSCVNST